MSLSRSRHRIHNITVFINLLKRQLCSHDCERDPSYVSHIVSDISVSVTDRLMSVFAVLIGAGHPLLMFCCLILMLVPLISSSFSSVTKWVPSDGKFYFNICWSFCSGTPQTLLEMGIIIILSGQMHFFSLYAPLLIWYNPRDPIFSLWPHFFTW